MAGAAGNKTAVVVVTPGAVLTDWRDNVSALLTAFLPGQEYGHSITEVLWGDVAPSGKLPLSELDCLNGTVSSGALLMDRCCALQRFLLSRTR